MGISSLLLNNNVKNRKAYIVELPNFANNSLDKQHRYSIDVKARLKTL